ncbi:MAG: hypothetical protein IJH11_06955, partial [Lachnospiraceae bacterium]|nr:hypothetical protein [Lachnospiraceae bacterium]
MRSIAEASKSCFRGAIAAFGPGGFHRVNGRGIKILIFEHDCCLWSWWVSSGQGRRHQNLDLLRMIAAFDLGGIHRVNGGSRKILIFKHDCCLCSWWVSSGQWQRHQKLD